MKHATAIAFALAFFALPALAADRSPAVTRGEQVALAGGCNDCHTPLRMGPKGPEPDMTQMLSGHPEKIVLPPPPPLNDAWNNVGSATNTAFAGPWGISYSMNLTPDPVTGIGKWREQDFVQTMRTGKHLGAGRPIQPPMPWEAYRHLSDSDLKALFAYLKSIPPISNRVPDYAPPKGK